MYPYKYKISIRLEHPSLDLTKMSEEVDKLFPGIIAGDVHVAGAERISKNGQKLGSHYGKSSFNFKFSDEMQDSAFQVLEESISEILNKLEAHKSFLQELTQNNIAIIFFIGVFLDNNSGIILNPKLIRDLSCHSIEVQFDIYP
jgi:hypothetical protein